MKTAAPPPRHEIEPRSRAPTFSVVIAAYQAADCIGEAIASALAQTEPAHEVIVCDDGSTDAIETALAPFRSAIEVIRKENGGEASAKNVGARAASGEFVAILDADDVYLPERLTALGQLGRQRPDLDILTSDAYLELDGKVIRRVYTPNWPFVENDQRRAILQRNFVFGHVAVRREALLEIGGFDEEIRRATDWDCWIRMIVEGAMVGAVLEPLARYRVKPASLSADRAGMLEGGLQSLGKALRDQRLDRPEQETVKSTMRRLERDLLRIRLNQVISGPKQEIRSRATRIAFTRSTPARTRVKAVVAAVSPRIAGSLLNRRPESSWTGAGGTTVDGG